MCLRVRTEDGHECWLQGVDAEMCADGFSCCPLFPLPQHNEGITESKESYSEPVEAC